MDRNALERLSQVRDHLTDAEASASLRINVVGVYINGVKESLEDMTRQVKELEAIITELNEKFEEEGWSREHPANDYEADLDAEEAFRMDAKHDPIF